MSSFFSGKDLIKTEGTDMLHELALRAFRDRPLHICLIPAWQLSGKAVLKRCLAYEIAHGIGLIFPVFTSYAGYKKFSFS
jgi:hypothetical protein